MRVLLDTHAFLWWVADSRRLSDVVRDAIRNEANDVIVSAVSAWEIATKHRLGKLPEAEGLAGGIRAAIVGQGFIELPISVADAERAGRLPGHHRDPFDRLLIAQGLGHDLALVSNEEAFDRYGAHRLW